MAGLTRRALLLGSGAVLGAAGARYLRPPEPLPPPLVVMNPARDDGIMNDASLLSETPVYRHILPRDDPGEALVAVLRAELKACAVEGRPISIGAARHSMGGQSIPRDGHAVTFQTRFLEADTDAGTYRVHAGTRWADVIAQLDTLGFSPKVMQSNNDFGVAATFSVNAHGWPVSHGPMGSSVRSLQMLLADGTLVRASRDENAGMFGAAMGGYGLIGLITELEVEMVPNRLLEATHRQMPAAGFGAAFVAAMAEPGVEMAYGRLNIDRGRFFEDGLMITYRPAADRGDLPPATGSGWMARRSRDIFRAQLGNDRVKRWRWEVETDIGPALAGASTRNSLINEPVITLDDRDPLRTDILHEYFVAPDAFPAFLDACRAVIPQSYQDLLNVTLRYVGADPDAVLAYAPGPRIAAVMLFSQEMTARAEADMARMTEALIEQVIAVGGTYYLPYRPHARLDQLARAYPRAAEFAALKRTLDPQGILRNGLWDRYLGQL